MSKARAAQQSRSRPHRIETSARSSASMGSRRSGERLPTGQRAALRLTGKAVLTSAEGKPIDVIKRGHRSPAAEGFGNC